MLDHTALHEAGQALVLLNQDKADLLQAQHEETLSLLAFGMAHDYNNILQSVMASVAMARAFAKDPAQVMGILAVAEAGWSQAKELGSNLQLLRQTREEAQQMGSLVPLLREVLDTTFQPPASTVTYAVPEDLPPARFSERQLARVFEVLARNAAEAMGGTGSIHLEATLARVALDDPLPLGPGEYLHLALCDLVIVVEALQLADDDIRGVQGQDLETPQIRVQELSGVPLDRVGQEGEPRAHHIQVDLMLPVQGCILAGQGKQGFCDLADNRVDP